METVIAPLIFCCVFLAVLGISRMLQPKVAKGRLKDLRWNSSPSPVAPTSSLVRRPETGMLGFFSRLGESKERTELGELRKRFVQAGFASPSAPGIFYGVRITLALALPAVALMLPIVWSLPTEFQIGLLGLLTTTGYWGPSIYIDGRAGRRKLAIERALPDALDLLVVCVEAGLGINQGLARVALEFRAKSPALSSEFALVGHETRAGKTTTEALRSLAVRTGGTDVGSLVALLVQTERFGTSVANVLRVHADAMRVRRMQHAEQRAQLATLKLILPSTMIFAALLMIFVAPGMFNFFRAFEGMPD